jgi:rhodanese-related sulfurtransferase
LLTRNRHDVFGENDAAPRFLSQEGSNHDFRINLFADVAACVYLASARLGVTIASSESPTSGSGNRWHHALDADSSTGGTGLMRNILRTISLALLLLKGGPAIGQQEGHTTEPLDQIKAKVKSGNAILVDVREKNEWDRGHIRGAVLLPLSELTAWERDGLSAEEKRTLAKALPKGSVVYCHCARGGRAVPGSEVLRKLGYDARALKPGYSALLEAGFPPEPAK